MKARLPDWRERRPARLFRRSSGRLWHLASLAAVRRGFRTLPAIPSLSIYHIRDAQIRIVDALGKPNVRAMRGKSKIQVSVIAVAALFLGACAGGSGISNSDNAIMKASVLTEDPAATGPVSVNLSAVANIDGIANTGSPVTDGGLDNDGYAYSETLLGGSLVWLGSTFTLGAAGVADAVSSTTIALPAGNDSTVTVLAAAVNGNQVNQAFIVNYTDGTSTSITQSVSDWYTPQNYLGETQVLKMAYRIAPSGATSTGPVYLYGYTFAINSTKTVQSITLPSNRNVVVLAINLTPAGAAPVSVNLSAVANIDGIANTGSPVTNGGLDNDGYAYSETLLGGSLVWLGSAFTLGAAGVADAVSRGTLTLPAGTYSSVLLLATGVNGNQVNQTFIVNYTDGTSTSITQSVSDWYTPQNYLGESQVLKMAYRIASSGATSTGPVYLYGYTFAINSTKTVQSITLPSNRNVVVLAIDLSPAGPAPVVAASPTMSPLPGSYSTAQTVTLSDTTPGAAIYYTTNGTTPTTSSAQYNPATPLQISSTTTIEAIAAASGYSNSAVVIGTYTIGMAPVSVNLSAVDHVFGIVANGSPVTNGGLDNDGYAYSATLTGTSVKWSGATFALGAAGAANAVSGGTLTLPAGTYSSVLLLATGVNGNQVNQTFIVNYTDGTSTSITQSVSDWYTPQNYLGESQVLKMAYRIASSGATSTGPVYLYGYTFAINSTKTVQSITLPSNRNVVVLAIDLSPAGPAPVVAASPTMSPLPGSYSTAQTVTLSDTTPGAAIYYTTNGTTPTTSSAQYNPATPLQISSTTTIEAIAAASGYSNSAVVIGTYTIGMAPVSVNLSAVANIDGIVNTGSPVSGGGVDGHGNAYSATLTGTSVKWSGATFALGAAGAANAVSSTRLALPSGNYSRVDLFATGVNGNQVNQTFIVNYTDGTSSSFVQSLSDWGTPQNYPGESMVLAMPYRLAASGATAAGPFYMYAYSFAINSGKTVQSITLPSNRNVVVFAITLIIGYSNPACDPLNFGAVGDGTTDNTTAIQNAVNSCAKQGGGNVELSVVGNNAVYLTGPFTLQSNVQLEIDNGVTLQGTNDHSRYVAAYINWVYEPNEALISAVGATNVGIIGAGVIDGAGGQLQPNGSPSWWTLQEQSPAPRSARPFMLEFYQCDNVTISGVTLQNAPMWNQTLRFSNDITESSVTVNAPYNAPNTDGVDIVGSTNVTLSNLNISVGDDNLALKSGLPIDPTDPRQVGLPQMATSQVQVTNVTTKNGDGITIGSEAVNGVNNVTIENVYYTYTSFGIRIKSARDRGGQIYDITAENLVMNAVYWPFSITDYYPGDTGPTEPPYDPAQPITATTPYVHDITIQNVVATGATVQSDIVGLPESCIHNVTLNNVSIQTSGPGIDLRHMTGNFINVTSTPASPPPFVVQENVTVTTSGTTPAITDTPPQTGQTACGAQVVPVP